MLLAFSLSLLQSKMVESVTANNNLQPFHVSVDLGQQGGSKCFDDDGRIKRTGMLLTSNVPSISIIHMLCVFCSSVSKLTLFFKTGDVWTASAHIITAVIGSGVLSLAWAIAQLGWVAGPAVMILFSLVTYYTSTLLAACYRCGDSVTGKRNYTYMDAIRANLGTLKSFLTEKKIWVWFKVCSF